MDEFLFTLNQQTVNDVQIEEKNDALMALESGKIIYFPAYSFSLQPEDQALLSESVLDSKHKNISYDYSKKRLAGFANEAISSTMQPFMQRYAVYARQLIDTLFPQYSDSLHWGRTSYRPAEIRGRISSKRKDDTRVHVDSFPATPVNGLRILRVFCNINPSQEPRVWHVGEPFAQVLKRFAPQIPPYSKARAKLLKLIKATKTLRSPYDHYMLHLHDTMKLDDNYQQTINKQRIDFPPQSTWIVFTDHVSHAALSGQFLLEQTFYLPTEAMAHSSHSPLKQWEQFKMASLNNR